MIERKGGIYVVVRVNPKLSPAENTRLASLMVREAISRKRLDQDVWLESVVPS